MGTMYNDVFMGTADKYNQKLEMLARMAQPERWTYKKVQDIDAYKILRNYIQFTYERIDEENKFLYSKDCNYRCMNTGLLTTYNQEIVAVFAKMKLKVNSLGFSMDFSKKQINLLPLILQVIRLWQITLKMLMI